MGPGAATNVTVQDRLPLGLEFVSATGSPGSYYPTTGLWRLDSVPAADAVTLSLVATAGAPGVITNTARISHSDQPDFGTANEAQASTLVVEAPPADPADVGITKTVSNPNPHVGDVVTFTVTMTNHGPDKSTGTQAEDVLPPGLTFISSSGDGNYNAGKGQWTGNLNMANGLSHTLHITALVATDGCFDNTATITHQAQEDPNPANNLASVTICTSPRPGRADLAVTKMVNNPTPNVGQTVIFTVGVHNNGPGQATGVALDDALPTGLTFVSATPSQGSFSSVDGEWTVGTLASGGNATLTLSAVVADANPQANTASITDSDVVDPDASNNNASATITPQQADVTVGKAVDNPAPNVGDTVHYTVMAGNLGPDTATNVTVTDLLPAGLSLLSATPTQGVYNGTTGAWTVGTIASGAAKTLTIAAQVISPDPITNTVSVAHSDQFDPNDGNNTSSLTITPQQADLQVTKSVSNPTPNVGDTVTFTVNLTDNGPDSATNVSVTDLLPAGLIFVTATPSEGAYSSATGVWTVGTVTVGTPQTISIQATVTSPAQVTNSASITHADQYDPDTTNNTDTATVIPQQADLGVSKSVDNPTPNVGDTIHYTVTVYDNGPDPVTGATVQDLLPAQVTFVAATATEGTYDSSTGLWTVGAVAVGTPQTLTITVTVVAAGISANTASIAHSDQYDPDPSNNSDTASVNPTQADLSLTKTVDNPTPNVGNQVTFTVNLTNNGPDSASGVTVSDPLPAGLTFVSAAASPGTSFNSATDLWDVGIIPDDGTASLQVVATVTSSGAVTNTASIASADQPDPDPGNNSSSVTVTPQQANLAVAKTVSDPTPNVGDIITFGVLVGNDGPDTATHVVLTDPVPAGLRLVSATTSQGTYDPITSLWNIGTIPPGTFPKMTVQAQVVSPSPEINRATVSHSDQFASNTNQDSASVVVIPQKADLTITKVVDNSIPDVGDTVTYTVTLTNNGPNTATGVAVSDPVTAGLTLVSATPDQGTYDVASGVWTVGTLANGESATLLIADQAAPDAKTNTATVSHSDQFDPDLVNNTATVTIDPLQADVALTKTVNNPHPEIGDEVVFTVKAANNGPDPAGDVTVLDPLPNGLSFVAAQVSQGTYDPGVGLWSVGTVAPGTHETLTVTALVVAAGLHTNSAEVSHSDEFDPDPSDNTATAAVTAASPPSPTSPPTTATTPSANAVSPDTTLPQAVETSAGLPTTGLDLVGVLAFALAILALGIALLVGGRRHSRT
jgi:uncharacterized repeat protein (TIGR01451 family)